MAIKERLTPGSILGFDELNDPVTPGETAAFKEVFGFHRCIFSLWILSLPPINGLNASGMMTEPSDC